MSTCPQNFSRRLLKWYHAHKRVLPWRGLTDPYLIWISEVMLQQTTVAAVIPKFLEWKTAFPNMERLARARPETVLKHWQGLGYYARARNLHAAARIMCRDYNGRVPDDDAVLRSLPGFGPYTAGAVLSIAYGQRVPIIDANIRRIIMRVLALPGRSETRHDQTIYNFLETIMPARSAGNFNQALMELGALICRQPKALCLSCPLRAVCLACQQGIQETIPQTVKKPLKEIFAVIAVIPHNGKYLIQQRPPTGLLGDLWEFPGGKIKPGEHPRRALTREIREELGIGIMSARHYMTTRHFYTEYKVHLDVWICTPASLPTLKKNQRWAGLKEFARYPFVSGSVKIIEKLRKDHDENYFDQR